MKKSPIWNAPEVSDNERVLATDKTKEEIERAQPLGIKPGPHSIKPLGIWYAFGNSWLEAVQDMFPTRSNRYNNVFIIEVGGNILKLETLQDHIDFTEKYSQYVEGSTEINWRLVAIDYDGIEAKGGTLRSETLSQDSKIAWLYGWDVDSGCTWNPQIKVIETLFTKDDPDWEEVKPRSEGDLSQEEIMRLISEYRTGEEKSWKGVLKNQITTTRGKIKTSALPIPEEEEEDCFTYFKDIFDEFMEISYKLFPSKTRSLTPYHNFFSKEEWCKLKYEGAYSYFQVEAKIFLEIQHHDVGRISLMHGFGSGFGTPTHDIPKYMVDLDIESYTSFVNRSGPSIKTLVDINRKIDLDDLGLSFIIYGNSENPNQGSEYLERWMKNYAEEIESFLMDVMNNSKGNIATFSTQNYYSLWPEYFGGADIMNLFIKYN